MPTVGTLTVDLKANTAEFSGDLGKAAQSAEEFGQRAAAAGDATDFSMRNARGSLMLMGDELGVRLPREIRTMIAEIPGIGLALEAVLPIMGAVFAVALIEKFIAKHREAMQAVKDANESLDSSMAKSGQNTKIKLLELEKEFDNLTGNHAAALVAEMKLLDAQTLQHLGGEFENLAKLGDKVFASLQKSETSFWFGGHWSSAAAQVKTDLDAFNQKLEMLAATGTKSEVAATVTQHLADVTAALNREIALQGKETGHKDRVEALRQELVLAQALNTEYANADKVEGAQKRNDNQKGANEEAERQAQIYEAQQRGLEQRRRAEERYTKEVTELHKKAAEETERIEEEQFKATEAVAEMERKVQTGLANEAVKAALTSAKLREAAEEQTARHMLVLHQANAQETLKADIAAAQAREKLELTALDNMIANLDHHDEMYLVKLQEFENKKRQIVQQSENEITKLRQTAEEKQYQDVSKAEDRMAAAIAQTVAKSILEHKNMAQAFERLGGEMLEKALENVLQLEMMDKRKQAHDAGSAASSAFKWVMNDVPFPVNAVLAPVAAAAAFAGVMAFEEGGEIPGSGPVPILAHGGETVVTKTLTDQVKNNVGGGGGGINIHFPAVQALDAEGVDAVLRKHAAVIQKHVRSELRKQGRR